MQKKFRTRLQAVQLATIPKQRRLTTRDQLARAKFQSVPMSCVEKIAGLVAILALSVTNNGL